MERRGHLREDEAQRRHLPAWCHDRHCARTPNTTCGQAVHLPNERTGGMWTPSGGLDQPPPTSPTSKRGEPSGRTPQEPPTPTRPDIRMRLWITHVMVASGETEGSSRWGTPVGPISLRAARCSARVSTYGPRTRPTSPTSPEPPGAGGDTTRPLTSTRVRDTAGVVTPVPTGGAGTSRSPSTVTHLPCCTPRLTSEWPTSSGHRTTQACPHLSSPDVWTHRPRAAPLDLTRGNARRCPVRRSRHQRLGTPIGRESHRAAEWRSRRVPRGTPDQDGPRQKPGPSRSRPAHPSGSITIRRPGSRP